MVAITVVAPVGLVIVTFASPAPLNVVGGPTGGGGGVDSDVGAGAVVDGEGEGVARTGTVLVAVAAPAAQPVTPRTAAADSASSARLIPTLLSRCGPESY